jgi:flagellar FliL protein
MSRKIEVDFKLLVVAIAFVIIATVGSAFATYLIFRSNSGPEASSAQASTKIEEMGPTFPVGEFILNLSSSGSHARFIRTEVILEASDKKVVAELEKRKPQIRDQFISLIRARTAEQLSNEAGMELLRFEMMKEANKLVNKGEVTNIYFVDLIIQ